MQANKRSMPNKSQGYSSVTRQGSNSNYCTIRLQPTIKKIYIYTECFKKSFTTLKAYRNLYRGHTQRFELSKCSKTHRLLPRVVIRNCFDLFFRFHVPPWNMFVIAQRWTCFAPSAKKECTALLLHGDDYYRYRGKRLTTGGRSAALPMEVTLNHNYPR